LLWLFLFAEKSDKQGVRFSGQTENRQTV